MRSRLSRVNEAAPHPSFLWRGLQTVDVNLLQELFLKVELDWMERIQVRVGGGKALVVHPSPSVAIPEPERKEQVTSTPHQNTCVPLRSSGGFWSELATAVHAGIAACKPQAHSSHRLEN